MIDLDGCIFVVLNVEGMKEQVFSLDGFSFVVSLFKGVIFNGVDVGFDLMDKKKKDVYFRVFFVNVAVLEIRKVNESYFGLYSFFGIYREMLSDKVFV